ncbi:MAG: hypothetical protein ACUVV0_08295 [Anaerolineae bacterium]
MPKIGGNTLRLSTAPPDAQVINNFPGRYPTEDWKVRYWAVTEKGSLEEKQAIIQLPCGYSEACLPVEVGYNGCIYGVRRWGLACYASILEEINFDPTPLLTRDRQRYPTGDEQEILDIMLRVTCFDLPGHFIIASPEHPFLLFDPQGVMKGGYTKWYTYLGALAYLVSGGRVTAPFTGLWSEDEKLYKEALSYLLTAIKEKIGR